MLAEYKTQIMLVTTEGHVSVSRECITACDCRKCLNYIGWISGCGSGVQSLVGPIANPSRITPEST